MLVNVQGLDTEEIELGTSDKFWKQIGSRRREKVLLRRELEAKLVDLSQSKRRR
jgi:hypothetical protein